MKDHSAYDFLGVKSDSGLIHYFVTVFIQAEEEIRIENELKKEAVDALDSDDITNKVAEILKKNHPLSKLSLNELTNFYDALDKWRFPDAENTCFLASKLPPNINNVSVGDTIITPTGLYQRDKHDFICILNADELNKIGCEQLLKAAQLKKKLTKADYMSVFEKSEGSALAMQNIFNRLDEHVVLNGGKPISGEFGKVAFNCEATKGTLLIEITEARAMANASESNQTITCLCDTFIQFTDRVIEKRKSGVGDLKEQRNVANEVKTALKTEGTTLDKLIAVQGVQKKHEKTFEKTNGFSRLFWSTLGNIMSFFMSRYEWKQKWSKTKDEIMKKHPSDPDSNEHTGTKNYR